MKADQLRQLFEAYFEGTLDETQAAELAAALREDETALARFVQDLELCNLLTHVGDPLDDGDEFVRSFWERVQAEQTAAQFASDFEARREQEAEVRRVAHHDDLLQALERDKQAAAHDADERAREEAKAREAAIRQAAEDALERFKAEERRRQEEIAYRLYVSRQRKLVLGITSLAALLIIVVCAWLFGPNHPMAVPPEAPQAAAPSVPPVPPVVVARVTRSSGVRWDRQDLAPKAGLPLTAGSLRLDEGFLEITFENEARIIVEAPAAVNLISARSARLDSGMLTAHVPEVARGFEVAAPPMYTSWTEGWRPRLRQSDTTNKSVSRPCTVTMPCVSTLEVGAYEPSRLTRNVSPDRGMKCCTSLTWAVTSGSSGQSLHRCGRMPLRAMIISLSSWSATT